MLPRQGVINNELSTKERRQQDTMRVGIFEAKDTCMATSKRDQINKTNYKTDYQGVRA